MRELPRLRRRRSPIRSVRRCGQRVLRSTCIDALASVEPLRGDRAVGAVADVFVPLSVEPLVPKSALGIDVSHRLSVTPGIAERLASPVVRVLVIQQHGDPCRHPTL